MTVAAFPPEPRQPCRDPDEAEEVLHSFLRRQGITDRGCLWCATLTARATVWLVHLRAVGESSRYAETLLQLAKREVRVRVLRHQIAHPWTRADRRAELEHQLYPIDHAHLPFDVTRPPDGWLAEDTDATP